jgi:CDGSH-type Zn-finger protein
MSKKITIVKDGPYIVCGNVPLAKEIIIFDADGKALKWQKGENVECSETYALCRCGKTCNKPFCDGSHTDGFNGKETASRKSFNEQARMIEGPDLILYDAYELCAGAGFCTRAGGVWELAQKKDKKSNDIAIEETHNCPAGRLVIHDKNGVMEPSFAPSISLVEDGDVEGPLWVKGNIPVISCDGTTYEVRNRVTLCRCGKSQNKPFCDGKHQ